MWYFLSYFTSIKLYDNFVCVCVGVFVKSVPSFTWMWKLCLSSWNPFKIHNIINTFRVYSYVFLHICIYKYTNIYLGVLHTHGGVASPSVWVFVSMYATRNNILVSQFFSWRFVRFDVVDSSKTTFCEFRACVSRVSNGFKLQEL